MNKRLVWIVASAVVVVLIVVGAVVGLRVMGQKTAEGHITVTAAKQQAIALKGRDIRIAGVVVPGSLSWDAKAGVTEFVLADDASSDASSIDVTYKGVMPNDFKPGDRVAVDGRILSESTFQASDIPSNALCNVCHS